jgi:hypothetical protein
VGQLLVLYHNQLMGPVFEAAHDRRPFPALDAHLWLHNQLYSWAREQGRPVLEGWERAQGGLGGREPQGPYTCTDKVGGPAAAAQLQ